MSNPFTMLKMAALPLCPAKERVAAALNPRFLFQNPKRVALVLQEMLDRRKALQVQAFVPGERQVAHLFRASREFCLQL